MKLLLIPVIIFFWLPVSAQKELKAFPLSSVQLSNGPFKEAQQTDHHYILQLDVDRLLAPFLKEAGIPPKKENYGNWENSGLDGHIGGHYLSALSYMYAATGNKELLRRLNYMVDWLDSCQRKNGDGYISGVPGGKAMWKDVGAGKINAASFSLNDKWVPLYNIHKLFAGLRDAWLVAQNQKAKTSLVRLSEWFFTLTRGLTEQQFQRMLRSEHGGMNEVFADVAAITGDPKYLQLARNMSHRSLLNPLLCRTDSLNGLHANTQIPKVIGYKRIAELSGDTAWAAAADYFWTTVVRKRSVSIGGNSVREHFHPSSDFSSMIQDVQGPETCNTYNMLRLTYKLFLTNPQSKYLDYYERAVYNHILSSQHPEGGLVYFTPMRPQHYRVYSQPQESFWCCVGSGMENHGKYAELIYAYDTADLYVNLFIASKLTWKDRSLVLEQQTIFPQQETSVLKLTLRQPASFRLHIRYPSWVRKGQMQVMVNGRKWPANRDADGFVLLDRTWKTGDVVSIRLPMDVKTEYLPDSSSWASFVYGPIVLGAQTGNSSLPGLRADGSRMGHVANGPLVPVNTAPFIVSNHVDPGIQILPVKGKPLQFTASSLFYPLKYKDLVLQPFYTIHDARYILYWRVTDPQGLKKIEQELKATERIRLALEDSTADQVAPGEQQPEADHEFKGDNTETGTFNDWHWRNATGWFSYQLRNKNKQGTRLRVTYYGTDRNAMFSISVNGVLVKKESLDGNHGQKLFDVDYQIPAEILNFSGESLEVRFAADPNSRVPRIFYLRLLK